jgi:hypothetical protein
MARAILKVAVVLMLPLMLVGTGMAATCVVDSTVDTTDLGTLRWCLASGETTIMFDVANQSTITLTSGLTISTSLTILGQSASGLTINGNQQGTVFTIDSGVTASISGLIITGGATSGGGGGGGGGINNSGTLTLVNTTVTGNSATGELGGGIYNGGTLTLVNTTVTGNSTNADGGGIYNGGTLTLVNTTVSGNSSSGDGGGIFSDSGTLTLVNSIIEGNTSPYDLDLIGAYTNDGGNLFNTNIDIPATPSLAPITNSSGLTLYEVPLPGSPAICTGIASVSSDTALNADILPQDERGAARPISYGGTSCIDSGAVQSDYTSVQFVTNTSFTGTVGTAITHPAAPVISVTEDGTSLGGVPITLGLSSGGAGTATGLGPVTTVAGAGATFSDILVSAAGASDELTAGPILIFGSYSLPAATASLSVAYPAPTVTAVSPNTGLTLGGTLVTITGTNFTGTTMVDFGGVAPTSFTVNSATSITATSPAIAVTGAVNVSVTNPSASSATSAADQFTYTAPTITVAPATSTLPGGTYGTAYAQTISASGGTAAYTYSVSAGSLPTGLTLTAGTLAGTPTAAGSYSFTITAKDRNSYTGSQTYTLVIHKAALNVAVNNASFSYGGTYPTFTGTAATLLNGDTAASVGLAYATTTATTNASAPGQYLITAMIDTAAQQNYTLTVTTGTLTISDATLTITVANATKVYGMANPTFTGTVAGQQGSETFTESFATPAVTLSPVGMYAITPSVTGTDLGDYAQTVKAGTLTVTQAASNTVLSVSSTSITPEQSLTLTAVVASTTSGVPTGTVSFYDGTALLSAVASSNGTATLSDSTLAPGITHSFSAVYAGDSNFLGSTASNSASVVVTPIDFSFSDTGTSAYTAAPGAVATYNFTLTPLYGSYAGTVSFKVTGLPPGATASFTPRTVAAGAGATQVVMTVQTAAGTAQNSSRPFGRGMVLALLFLPLLRQRRVREALRGKMLLPVLLMAGLTATLTGCGSNNNFMMQSPQTYTLTMTASSGALQHSQTVTLIVQ